MSFLTTLWDRLKTAIEGEATTVELTMSELEQKLMPGFSALCQKIEATIGAQGMTILEQGIADIGTLIASGGSITAAVATLIPQVTAQVTADLKQDANTAAHGALDLLVATLPAPAVPAAPTAPAAPAA